MRTMLAVAVVAISAGCSGDPAPAGDRKPEPPRREVRAPAFDPMSSGETARWLDGVFAAVGRVPRGNEAAMRQAVDDIQAAVAAAAVGKDVEWVMYVDRVTPEGVSFAPLGSGARVIVVRAPAPPSQTPLFPVDDRKTLLAAGKGTPLTVSGRVVRARMKSYIDGTFEFTISPDSVR